MCLIADYFGRKPTFNERIDALTLLKCRIPEIDDMITRAEEFETENKGQDDFEDDEEAGEE